MNESGADPGEWDGEMPDDWVEPPFRGSPITPEILAEWERRGIARVVRPRAPVRRPSSTIAGSMRRLTRAWLVFTERAFVRPLRIRELAAWLNTEPWRKGR